MKLARCFLAGACLAGLAAAPAQAAVAVSFVDPAHYSDASTRYAAGEGPLLATLRQYLVALGERYLRPGQSLAIEVLDVDLAGEVEWWRPYGYDLRVMREVTPPRMRLRYTLAQGGQPLAAAEEALADPDYLHPPAQQRPTDPLRYEKAMLARWFEARFGPAAPH